ncbi:basic amino acid ABC transporter substrate-binding protein [Mesorhizobium wenxiniae]|nr:basic amino acid ABC transporter substrate-binding protein [Mesorhizobium wenxiniae]
MIASLSFGALASAQDPVELIFATDPTYPPFEYNDNATLVGFDIDLMAAIGKAAGFSVKFESVPFSGIIPALKAGTYDGAIAAISATEERAKSIAFSKPYFKTGIVIVVPEADESIRQEDDLKGKHIAVEIGSVGATKATTIRDAKISTYDTPNSLLELAAGNVEAALGDASQVQYAIATGQVKGIKVLPNLLSTDFYVIGFSHGSTNVDLVNTGLQKVLDSGEYAKIYKRWFKDEPVKF